MTLISFTLKPRNLFIFFAFAVLLLQPYKVGFEKGHHGWVTSHTLAIISRATPEHCFLGFTRELLTDEGVEYSYFDRYPVFFSGVTHLLLKPFWDDLSLYIYFSRQWMNIIFIALIWLVWRINRKLADEEKAIIATAFVASSAFLIKYKDMVHYDQPALLGCLLALNGILDYELTNKKKFLWLAAILGPLLGRGYAVVFFLAAWFVIRLWDHKPSFGQILKEPSLKFLALSVPLPALMLALNIAGEANIRNTSWEKTSIVISAKHRLGFNSYKTKDKIEKPFRWGSFLNNQFQRSLDVVTPFAIYGIHAKNYKKKLLHYSSLIPKFIFQIFLCILLFKFWRPYWNSQDPTRKRLIKTYAVGGVIWILVMRNLANYHDYVSMYLIGLLIVLALFLSDLVIKKRPQLKFLFPAVLGLSLLINLGINYFIARDVNWQSDAFQTLRTQIKENRWASIYFADEFESFIEGVPHAVDFYISGFRETYKLKNAEVQVFLNERTLSVARNPNYQRPIQ